MEQSLIELILGQTGLAGVAVLALVFMHKDHKRQHEEIKRQRDREREDKVLLIEVLSHNTEAITALRETVDRLDRNLTKNGG